MIFVRVEVIFACGSDFLWVAAVTELSAIWWKGGIFGAGENYFTDLWIG